jgi:hypothetical protein
MEVYEKPDGISAYLLDFVALRELLDTRPSPQPSRGMRSQARHTGIRVWCNAGLLRPAVVGVAGAVPVSAPCVTCAAITLMCGQDLLRTMEKCGPSFTPLQRCGASLTILYHSWQRSASSQKNTRYMELSLSELPRFPVV